MQERDGASIGGSRSSNRKACVCVCVCVCVEIQVKDV